MGQRAAGRRNREKLFFFAMFVTTWAVPTLAPWVPAFQLPWVRGTDCLSHPTWLRPLRWGEAEAGGHPASAATARPSALQGSTKASTQGSRWRGCWLRLAGVAELTGRTLG